MKNQKVYTEPRIENRSVYTEPRIAGRSGQIIIVGIVFLAVVLTMASSLFSRVSSFMSFSSASVVNEQATNLAEAGLEKALWQLNQTAGGYTGETNTALGTSGTFTVSIVNNGSNLKTITATGYVPSSTKPRSKRIIKVDTAIDSSQISFHYAVQVGTGGVNMQNSSIINGTVYTLGNITGSGSSIINGDAFAVGAISSPDPTILGSTNPNQSNPPDMPTIDYQYWQDEATAGGVTNCAGTCTFSSGTPNLGPRKYIGNLVLQNTAAAVMNGPIYVTGNITVKNSATLKLNNSFGSNGTVLITDSGKITTENSGGFLPTCTNPPTCTTPSPKGYILVVTASTANDAIKIQNSGVNAIFYALMGGADLANTAQVTALVANKLEMENAANLTYDQGLANANFTSGPGASWLMKKGTYKNYQN